MFDFVILLSQLSSYLEDATNILKFVTTLLLIQVISKYNQVKTHLINVYSNFHALKKLNELDTYALRKEVQLIISELKNDLNEIYTTKTKIIVNSLSRLDDEVSHLTDERDKDLVKFEKSQDKLLNLLRDYQDLKNEKLVSDFSAMLEFASNRIETIIDELEQIKNTPNK